MIVYVYINDSDDSILIFCDLFMYIQLKPIFKWKETIYATG